MVSEQMDPRGELLDDPVGNFFHIQPVLPEKRFLGRFGVYRELGSFPKGADFGLIDFETPEQESPEQRRFKELLRKTRCLEAFMFCNIVKESEVAIRNLLKDSEFQTESQKANFCRQHEIVPGLHPGLNLTHYEYVSAKTLQESYKDIFGRTVKEKYLPMAFEKAEFVGEYLSEVVDYIKEERIWLHLALSLHQRTLFEKKGDLYQAQKEWFWGVSRAAQKSMLDFFYKMGFPLLSGNAFFPDGWEYLFQAFLKKLEGVDFSRRKKEIMASRFCGDAERRWVAFPSNPTERFWREMERMLFSSREGVARDFQLGLIERKKRRVVLKQIEERVRGDELYRKSLLGEAIDSEQVIREFPLDNFLEGDMFPGSAPELSHFTMEQ